MVEPRAQANSLGGGVEQQVGLTAPMPGSKRRKGVSLDFSTPISLSTATLSTSMVGTSDKGSQAQISPPFGAATVSISPCGPNVVCN